MKELSTKEILSGDKRALAKALTGLESLKIEHKKLSRKLIESLMTNKQEKKTIRIGVSGTPGVGKSTFIETLGKYILKDSKKLAVLAIDPTSPLSGGSILGDKTRMEELSRSSNCYIRPTPTRGHLGGVSTTTQESIKLCEYAGYDVIIVETVGVGQSEYEITDMIDLFLVLIEPQAGDELQGIKKGIMELANFVVINKSDGENLKKSEQTKNEYQNALMINGEIGSDQIKKEVITISAQEDMGVSELWENIKSSYANESFIKIIKKKRYGQLSKWRENYFFQRLKEEINQSKKFQILFESEGQKMERNETNIFLSTEEIIKKLIKAF